MGLSRMSALDLPSWALGVPRAARVALLLAGGFHVEHAPDEAVIVQLGSHAKDVALLAAALTKSQAGQVVVALPGRRGGPGRVVLTGGKEFAWTDHMAAWLAVAADLRSEDLDRLQAVVLEIFPRVHKLGKEGKWLTIPSTRLLDGLAESVALLGNSDDLIGPTALGGRNPSTWADATVQQLFSSDPTHFVTLARWLPLFAEASPKTFVEQLLCTLESQARAKSWTHASLRFDTTELLHSLQILGWDSALMPQIARCLALLLAADPAPRRSVSPTPLSVLSGLLGYAMPQTTASPEQRLAVLTNLTLDATLRDSARVLLLSLWSDRPFLIREHAARPRFLHLDIPTDVQLTTPELTYSQLETYASLLMTLAAFDARHWAELVAVSHVPDSLACHVLEQLLRLRPNIEDPDGFIWAKARGIKNWLARAGEPARSRPAFQSRVELTHKVYSLYEPTDLVARSAWLFAVRPTLAEELTSYTQLGPWVRAHQQSALAEMWMQPDRWELLSRLADLSVVPSEPDKPLVPSRLALALCETPYAEPLEARLKESKTFEPFSKLAPSFLARCLTDRAFEQTEQWIYRLVAEQRIDDAFALAIGTADFVRHERSLWLLLDKLGEPLRKQYWQKATGLWMRDRPSEQQELAVARLLEYCNLPEALHLATHDKNAISTSLRLAVLEKLAADVTTARATDAEQKNQSIDKDLVVELFRQLIDAPDVDSDRACDAELRLLESIRTVHGYEPLFVARAISQRPAWLADLVRQDRLPASILSLWQGYPGDEQRREAQAAALESWCLQLLQLLSAHRETALGIVGMMLARPAPDAPDGIWPCRTARRFLDLFITDPQELRILGAAMMGEKRQERGMTSRAIGEGGAQERALAEQFLQGAERLQAQKWPRTAALLLELAQYYQEEARRHDDDAVDDAWRYNVKTEEPQDDVSTESRALFPLRRVKLENFRSLRDLNLELDPVLNVFVGRNASGKTTVLDAIAAGLASVQDELFGTNVVDQLVDPRIDRTVVDWTTTSTQRQADFLRLQFWGQPSRQDSSRSLQAKSDRPAVDSLRWSIETSGPGKRSMRRGRAEDSPLSEPLRAVKRVLARREQGPPAVPIFAYYGTKRALSQDVLTQDAKQLEDLPDGAWRLSRAAAYDGALDATASYQHLVSWWRSKQSEEVELQAEHKNFSLRLPALEAIRDAVAKAVRVSEAGGMRCTNPRTKAGVPGLIVDFDRGEGGSIETVELGQLADGFRTHLALVMDLARRMVQANPPSLDPSIAVDGWGTRSYAVVLIDEVDLHLHPSWQRYVLDGLRAAFPNTQFIVTTHSPQVIATVARQHVKLLSNGGVISDLFVEGRDTNGLLETVFGIAPRPAEMQRELHKLFVYLDDERFAEAKPLLETLETKLGPNDEAMVRARWLLDIGTATETGEPQQGES